MSSGQQYFSGAQALKNIDLENLLFDKSNKLGEGYFSKVYEVKDKKGNSNPNYVVKRLLKGKIIDRLIFNINRQLGDVLSESSFWLKPNFEAEVNALVHLKGQQIGPNIVYANYNEYYYIIEKLDNTLEYLMSYNLLTPSQIMKLLALGDRYLRSNYMHNDMHSNNIMWSEDLNDFRIIDWGIYLIIKPETKLVTKQEKERNIFWEQIIWLASVYTKRMLEEGGPKLEQWNAVAQNISNYIERHYPDKIDSYDIFSPNYDDKERVQKFIELILEFNAQNKTKTKRKGGKKNRGTRKIKN
jgi:serine/threonine protein kinase